MSLTWRGITKAPGNSNVNQSPPLFRVPIVLISLTPALSKVFVLTYLSTRSIVHAIPLIVTSRSAVVSGLKICEYKSPFPDAAQTSLSFLVKLTLFSYIRGSFVYSPIWPVIRDFARLHATVKTHVSMAGQELQEAQHSSASLLDTQLNLPLLLMLTRYPLFLIMSFVVGKLSSFTR